MQRSGHSSQPRTSCPRLITRSEPAAAVRTQAGLANVPPMKRLATAAVLVAVTASSCSSGPTAPDTAPASVTIFPAKVTIKDEKGDEQLGDVTSVTFVRTADELRMTVKTTEDLVWKDQECSVYLNLFSVDGSKAMQAGVKWLDKRQIGYFVFDSVTATQQNIPGKATHTKKMVTATFPTETMQQLGQVWTWQLVTSVGGSDFDKVPEPGDDELHPDRAALAPP